MTYIGLQIMYGMIFGVITINCKKALLTDGLSATFEACDMLLLLICYESHNPKNIVIMATIKAINGIDSNTSNPITI